MITIRYRDVAKLIVITPGGIDSDGYPTTPVETFSEIYVDVKSVARTEFYASLQAGINIVIAFETRVEDYNNEKIIEYDNKRYQIQRTYTKNGEMIELNCSDLAV